MNEPKVGASTWKFGKNLSLHRHKYLKNVRDSNNELTLRQSIWWEFDEKRAAAFVPQNDEGATNNMKIKMKPKMMGANNRLQGMMTWLRLALDFLIKIPALWPNQPTIHLPVASASKLTFSLGLAQLQFAYTTSLAL